MLTWFSSDYHFFHNNIIKYCDRPFNNVHEMNTKIITEHNNKVGKEDTVYFLGDFGFYASESKALRGEGEPYYPDELLKKMNGKQWYFVKGNHDKSSNKFKPKAEVIILNQNGLRIQLIHDPIYANINYDLIICGHKHDAWKVKELHYCGEIRLIINVSVDVWNFTPVKLDEILSIYYRWKKQRSKINRWEQPAILKELNKGTNIEKS